MPARFGAGKRAQASLCVDVEYRPHGRKFPLRGSIRDSRCDALHIPGRRMTLKGKLRCVGMTDTGKVREHNEDTIAFDADIGLLVLADGMGGYNAGEVASGIAVKTIVNLVRESVEREDWRVHDASAGLTRASIILRDAILRANKIIFQTARTQPQCEGMGTTVVGAL